METGLNILDLLEAQLGPMKLVPETASSQTLAFVGDAVYSLIARVLAVSSGSTRPEKLHKRTTDIVSAKAQSHMADLWQEHLTEEESDVYRRGKNTHTVSSAKNASSYDYHKATGLEALAGYLYLKGRSDRLIELMMLGIKEMEH